MTVIRTIFMTVVIRTCLRRFLFLLLVMLVLPRGVEGENTLTLKDAPGDIRPWSFLHLQEAIRRSQGDVRRISGRVKRMPVPVVCHIGGRLYLNTPPEPLSLHHMATLPQPLLQLLGQHLHDIR